MRKINFGSVVKNTLAVGAGAVGAQLLEKGVGQLEFMKNVKPNAIAAGKIAIGAFLPEMVKGKGGFGAYMPQIGAGMVAIGCAQLAHNMFPKMVPGIAGIGAPLHEVLSGIEDITDVSGYDDEELSGTDETEEVSGIDDVINGIGDDDDDEG